MLQGSAGARRLALLPKSSRTQLLGMLPLSSSGCAAGLSHPCWAQSWGCLLLGHSGCCTHGKCSALKETLLCLGQALVTLPHTFC